MNKSRPSQELINSEIAKLKELQNTVVETGLFGNNRNAIAAQIDVLEKRMSQDTMYDLYGEEAPGYEENVFDAALDAAYFLRGEFTEPTLSEGWEPLTK